MDELVRAGQGALHRLVELLGGSRSRRRTRRRQSAALRGSCPRRTTTRWLDREAERELVPACERLGIGVIPYFPLASGLLTGKYRRGRAEPGGDAAGGAGSTSPTSSGSGSRRSRRSRASAGRRLLDVAIGGLAAQPAVAR